MNVRDLYENVEKLPSRIFQNSEEEESEMESESETESVYSRQGYATEKIVDSDSDEVKTKKRFSFQLKKCYLVL
jgi:hypothetical protein